MGTQRSRGGDGPDVQAVVGWEPGVQLRAVVGTVGTVAGVVVRYVSHGRGVASQATSPGPTTRKQTRSMLLVLVLGVVVVMVWLRQMNGGGRDLSSSARDHGAASIQWA